jgi:membrane protein implicated in regulation of membrane protease activity
MAAAREAKGGIMKLAELATDLLCLAGLALLTLGLYLIWLPLAPLVVGVMLLALGLWRAR